MTNAIGEFRETDCIFVIGSNTTEAHPVIAVEIKRAAARGTKLIVADPRAIDLTRHANLYLSHRPGTDTALINALIRCIIKSNLHDTAFIEAETEDFQAMVDAVEEYTPEHAAEITGVPAKDPALTIRRKNVSSKVGTQEKAPKFSLLGETPTR